MTTRKENDRKEHGMFLRKRLSEQFLNHFKNMGFDEHPSVLISSGVDKTVCLVGAAISVLKPYILESRIPKNGLVISQPCIRTHNLRKYFNDASFFPVWGSSFTNLELIAPSEKLDELVGQTKEFLEDHVGIRNSDIIIHVSSQDRIFIDICKKYFLKENIIQDFHPPYYYTHSIGIEDFSGINFNIAIRSEENLECIRDIGNVILFSNKRTGESFLEIGFGDTAILQQVFGFNHVMDSYDFSFIPIENERERRILQDCIITCFSLFSENLVPSNKSSQDKILYHYTRGLYHFSHKNGIGLDQLEKILSNYEMSEFPDNKEKNITKRIMETLFDKQKSILSWIQNNIVR